MKKLLNRLSRWFFQIENEVMIPFLTVGIIVIGAFSLISYYNGYTMQRESQRTMATTLFDEINRDLNFLDGKLPEEEIRSKYQYFGRGRVRITDTEGNSVSQVAVQEGQTVFLSSEGSNRMGWKLEYLINEREFAEEILEKQNYVIVGAIAALMIICQASIFIAHSITRPIRNMSSTCQDINNNKGSYRSYRFDAVNRRDEIGQLALTFEGLLRNMDNYTKMEYTSRMSATLAHEIKNPIAGIRSGIQLLQGRASKEGERMLCDSMIREIDRVNTLIMNLFTLSVKKESPKTEVSLSRVLQEIAMIYARGPEGQRVTIQTEVEEGLTAWLNENEFRQIIHNLISNSMKAMSGEREGVIRILGTAKGRLAQVYFQDNGHGMTKEELARAIEPFYTRSINGVGIGLAIVKKLVEQNDGKMELQSCPGEGTVVTLTFCRKGGGA